MSNTTLIIGESGSGKSSSLRNLNPKDTFVINVLNKPLPFKGFKNKYNPEAKNYLASDDYIQILSYIKAINERRDDIKILIIDDFQYVMGNEFMNRATEKGFDKFSEIANHAWLIIKALISTREDLYCFVLSHSDTDQNGRMKCKTIGKMLDDKITLEGMFSVILHSQVVEGKYQFLTQNNGTHIAKSPIGMFEDIYIDNDLEVIQQQIESYFNDEE